MLRGADALHTSPSDPALHENIISFARKVTSDEISTNLFEVKQLTEVILTGRKNQTPFYRPGVTSVKN